MLYQFSTKSTPFSAAIYCSFSCNEPRTLTTAHIHCIWSCRTYNWSKSYGDGTFCILAM